MFYPGTKIVIVESSAKKKSPGVRPGSLGNISTVSEPQFIHGMDVVACVCVGYFTRYGFEKQKNRMEKKRFINIFPVVNQQKITTGKIDRQIEKIFKGDLDGIYHECGVDYTTPVVIACPVINCGINIIEDHNEFTPWFHSVMTSNMIHYASTIDPLNQYHRKYLDLNDDNFHKEIRDLISSRAHRADFANIILAADAGRKERFARRLAAMISIYSKVSSKQLVLRTTNHVNGKRKINQEALCANLAVMFFNGSIKGLLNIPTKNFNKMIIDNVITTGNHLWGLSHRTLGLVGGNQETKGE